MFMIHYFYKITNKRNNKFYYGVHSTNDINDGYMGSGVILRQEQHKYGLDSFYKEIIKTFDTKKEAYNYESVIVNEDMINNPLCYNISTGGQGGKVKSNYIKDSEYKKKISDGVKRYYSSEEGKIRKQKIKKERAKYWSSEAGEQMKKNISENNKKFYKTEKGILVQKNRIELLKSRGRSKEAIERQRNSINKYWNSEEGNLRRLQYHVKYSGKNSSSYGRGSRYNVLDTIENKLILVDYTSGEISKYFNAPIYPNYYIQCNKLYKKRYRFESISTKQ